MYPAERQATFPRLKLLETRSTLWMATLLRVLRLKRQLYVTQIIYSILQGRGHNQR